MGSRTGNSGRDHDDVGAGQSILQAVILGQVAGDFLTLVLAFQPWGSLRTSMAYSNGRDMREIGSNTRGVDNIVKGEFIDEGRGFEQERKGLNGGQRYS